MDAVLGVVFLVFLGITLGPSLVGRDVLVDANLLSQFQPWKAVTGTAIAATNVCRSDTIDTVMPTLGEIRRSLYRGQYPTWSPYVVGGGTLTPPNYGQFSPLALPYYVLPLWLAPAFVKLVEFLVVLGGMVAFTRRLRMRVAAGVLGAIVFCASGFMLEWSNWPQTRTAALIPALFWATERLAQDRRVRSVVALALVVLVMLLGGFPAVTGMALYLAGAYFVVRLVVLHRRAVGEIVRRLLLAVGALALGAVLGAWQLVPFAELLSQTDLSYRDAIKGNFSPLYTLLTLVSPDVYGTCVAGEVRGGNSPIETIAFVGAAALVLAVVAVVWPRARRARRASPLTDTPTGVIGFFAVAAAGSLVVGWLGGPLLTLLQHLPVFSNNSIWRIRSVLGFVLAVLAAFGFDRLLAGRGGGRPTDEATGDDTRIRSRSEHRRPAQTAPVRVAGRLVVVAAAAWLGVETLLRAREASITGNYYRILRQHVEVAALLVGLTLVLVLVVRLAPRVVGILATLAVAGLVVGQSASFGAVDLGGSSRAGFYPVTPVHAFLQQHLGDDRFASADLQALPSTATFYELRTPTGHQFTVGTWADLLQRLDPKVFKTPTFSDFNSAALPLSSVGSSPLLDRLAVRYWLAPDGSVPGTTTAPVAGGADVRLTDAATLTCTVPTAGLRAVVLHTTAPVAGSPGVGASVSVRVTTPTGTLAGGRYVGAGLPAAGDLVVPVPGEDVTGSGPLTVRVSATGLSAPASFWGNGSGGLACGTVAPVEDGLKLVESTPGTTVYQRLTSLPRIRWAANAVVLPASADQVTRLARGVDPDTVLLGATPPGAPSSGAATPTSGTPTSVRVDEDRGSRVAATTTSTSAGYLVVADALQQRGWSATVDGRPAALLPADHAFAAVAVPAGTHEVELHYTAPGLRIGTILSLVGVLVLVGLLLGPVANARLRRQPVGSGGPEKQR